MRETHTDVRTVRIVHGRPWKDAIIKILEPRCPYRPWSARGDVKPGDALIIVLDTDPVSVLASVGIVGADGDIDNAIAGTGPFGNIGLMELGTLNMLADFVVRPDEETVYHCDSPQQIVDTVGRYSRSEVEARSGHTSLTAGRVLLASNGKCTACGDRFDLTGDDARKQVHIHTVDVDVEGGRADWPAALCDSCSTRMRQHGISSFTDFRFSLNPACPNCGARHSMSAVYGLLAGPITEPWYTGMGCVIDEQPAQWVCGDCRHQW